MSTPVERCPLCQSPKKRPFESIRDGETVLHYFLCTDCGMVYQSPRMSDEEIEAYYEAQYRLSVQASEGPTEKDYRIQAGRARYLLGLTRRGLPAVHRHLDIGSSTGLLLSTFSASYGSEGVGVEPGEAYRRFSLERGVQAYGSLDELPAEQRNTFDLISIIHVLEHLPDPIGYLRRLRADWLTPGGALLIEVPNLFGHDCFSVPHVGAYSRSTLCYALRKAGFAVDTVKIHGQPRSYLLPLYITALAHAEEGVRAGKPVPIGVRLRRRAGVLYKRLLTRAFPNQVWLPLPAAIEEGE